MRGTARHPYSAAQGRGRGGAGRGAGGLGHRGLRLPPLHRRRAGGDAAARPDPAARARAADARARALGARQGARAAAGPARPRRALPARPPRRRRRGALRRGDRRTGSPASTTSPGPGELTVSDLAHELGWHAVPAPQLAVGAAAEAIAHMPFLPGEAAWIETVRRPVLMDTSRARRKLHWMPHHDARETLRADDRRRAIQVSSRGFEGLWRLPGSRSDLRA